MPVILSEAKDLGSEKGRELIVMPRCFASLSMTSFATSRKRSFMTWKSPMFEAEWN
jgi:hypothetical protein